VDYLASSSGELSAAATSIAGGSTSQSARAAQVATASQEMSSTIAEITRSVSCASEAAKAANEVAENGGKIVVKTIESMDGISKTAKESSGLISGLGGRSREIGSIITVIEDIADQTNLLALNAAIEAARAGEQGRGFAVVADEVRRLAEKTMKATKEIDTMIRAMQDETGKAIASMENEVSAVGAGARLAEEAGASLNEIVSRVEVVTRMIETVMVAIQQQQAATEQICCDMESVSMVVAQTSESAGQIAGASSEMATLASNLKQTVDVFKVSRGVDEELVLERARLKNNVAPLMKYAS
jgi:methyl-accepting chemotaxis protein